MRNKGSRRKAGLAVVRMGRTALFTRYQSLITDPDK
jgi:hypothetical protein